MDQKNGPQKLLRGARVGFACKVLEWQRDAADHPRGGSRRAVERLALHRARCRKLLTALAVAWATFSEVPRKHPAMAFPNASESGAGLGGLGGLGGSTGGLSSCAMSLPSPCLLRVSGGAVASKGAAVGGRRTVIGCSFELVGCWQCPAVPRAGVAAAAGFSMRVRRQHAASCNSNMPISSTKSVLGPSLLWTAGHLWISEPPTPSLTRFV